VAYGLNWISKEELTKSIGNDLPNLPNGKLSKNEILEVVRSECARGANGLPVLYSRTMRIAKKPKRK
jgi:hypothetical protein